jgi:tRNA pseudouridine32 synthase/23S rRNA pseudouridine746 synthase
VHAGAASPARGLVIERAPREWTGGIARPRSDAPGHPLRRDPPLGGGGRRPVDGPGDAPADGIGDTGAMTAPGHDLPSRLQLPPGPWMTLLDGMCARFPGVDRDTWCDRFRRGRVQDAHGVGLPADTPYRVGMEVRYFREVRDEPRIPFAEAIVHADDDLVVADKPHFLPVVPAGPHVRETLLARLVERFDNPHLVPLHRIDRETAGLVLFSANPATRGAYQALFRERRIRKRYRAIAAALPSTVFPCVRRTRIEPGEPFPCMHEADGEPNSQTRIDVAERDGARWTYALEPVTGRKHQLRVHMAALGAPIEGDPLYPPGAAGSRPPGFDRPLRLLAHALDFIDPLSGNARSFASLRVV